MVTAVGAGGILANFTDGQSVLNIYPSAGTIPMHPYGSGGERPRAALTAGKSSWGISIGPYNKRATKTGRRTTMPIEDLRQSEMMSHLLDALDKGEDIGHYGRLTFAMVAHHFLDKEELVEWLSKDGDTDESEARALVQQVEERGYNPPKRERILEWQNQQDFPICPNPDDPDACNVYRELDLPDEIFENIQDYREDKAS
jgi:hypothetical protein